MNHKITNESIMKIAMQQSAYDINCNADDFLKEEHVVVTSCVGLLARKYYKEPIACNLVSYGNNIVASVREEYREIVKEYINKFEFYHCFETPNMHWLDERMETLGQKVCFMAEYYLPNVKMIKRLTCEYELKVLEQKDFADLYKEEWGNALCEARKEFIYFY